MSNLEPLVELLLEQDERGLPFVYLSLEGLDVGRAAHRLRLDDVVVEQQLDVVHRREYVRAGLAVRHECELDLAPLLGHLVQRLLQRVLLAGRLADQLELGHMLGEVHVDDALQVGVLGGLELVADDVRYGVPVAIAHARIEERRDERQELLEVVDLGAYLGGHFARHRLILKLPLELVQLAPVVLHVGVHLVGHHLAHRTLHPVLVLGVELDADLVQLEIGLESVEDLHALRILGDLPAERLLLRVEELDALVGRRQLLLEHLRLLVVLGQVGHLAALAQLLHLLGIVVELFDEALASQLQRLLELHRLLLHNRLVLVEHLRQAVVPRERLIVRADLSGRQRRHVEQELETQARLVELLLQLEDGLRLGLVHRLLELDELSRVGGRGETLLGDALVLLAQLAIGLEVVGEHAVEQLGGEHLGALGQRADELVAVQLEHADADDAVRAVRDLLDEALVLFHLALVLVERVLVLEEGVHLLLGLAADQRHVLLVRLGVVDRTATLRGDHLAQRVLVRLHYVGQDDGRQAARRVLLQARLLLNKCFCLF